MRFLILAFVFVVGCMHLIAGSEMVLVEGGKLPKSSKLAGQKVATFEICKYEVTWAEWQEVRGWAVENGYDDLGVPGIGDGAGGGWKDHVGVGSEGNHPVRYISWYDAIKWCNAKSEKECLDPVYYVQGNIYKTGSKPRPSRTPEPADSLNIENTQSNELKYDINILDGPHDVYAQSQANGYRLPTEAEWEWAQRGGRHSRGFVYSGSNNIDEVGWYAKNSINSPLDLESGYVVRKTFTGPGMPLENNSRGTWPVGKKIPNELGIYDMSGNVQEWVFDVQLSESQRENLLERTRRYRGGCWSSYDLSCEVADRTRSYNAPNARFDTVGFRLARNSP